MKIKKTKSKSTKKNSDEISSTIVEIPNKKNVTSPNIKQKTNDDEKTTGVLGKVRKRSKKKKRFNKRNKYLHLVLAKAQLNNGDSFVKQEKTVYDAGTIDVPNKKIKEKTEDDCAHENRKVDLDDPENIKEKRKSLRSKMLEKLSGSHFRYLNEKLYTSTGEEAFNLFQEDPSLYDVYHQGFRVQVSKWPENPLKKIIKEIKSYPRELVIADFGCGDATLAASVKHEVHSFDLVAVNDTVTVCDMAHVPLKDKSVDVAVFCLSLMGTNFVDYLVEANRVLKMNGILKIAEITSRFKNVDKVMRRIEKLGFKLLNKDDSNQMFVYFDYEKCGKVNKNRIPKMKLNPCVYKKR